MPEARTHTGRLFHDTGQPIWKLFLKAVGLFHDGAEILAIHKAGIKGIDIQRHAILVMKPLKEGEIGKRLLLGRPFIGVIDPREILGFRRRGLVSTRLGMLLTLCCGKPKGR